MEVRVTWSELEQGVLAGAHRRMRRLRSGSVHRWGYAGEGSWTAEIEAAAAEMAVAKLLGCYWADFTAPDHNGDVGDGLQVRHTPRRDGRLIIHPEDEDDHRFVLVCGEAPTFFVAGQILGAEAKRQEWWVDPGTGRPAFFVPQAALQAIRPHSA
jgi:hypothetical protein